MAFAGNNAGIAMGIVVAAVPDSPIIFTKLLLETVIHLSFLLNLWLNLCVIGDYYEIIENKILCIEYRLCIVVFLNIPIVSGLIVRRCREQ